MELKNHSCPECGSKNLESYMEGDRVHIKCEDCGKIIRTHTFRKIRPELLEIKRAEESVLKNAIPVFIGMVIFAVTFAIILRIVSGHFGMPF